MRTVPLPPYAPTLIESTRAIGYTLEAAIADIVDNSTPALASCADIFFFPVGDSYIAVLDDGYGMDAAKLEESMRYGSQNPNAERGPNDLGRFGLGLKTASLSQCRTLTSVLRHKGFPISAGWQCSASNFGKGNSGAFMRILGQMIGLEEVNAMASGIRPEEIISYTMSRIRSKNTKPEMLVRKYLFSKGLRYRKNDKRYPGCPDIVLPKYKAVVFVNGCFWHMHEGKPCFSMPKTRREYWEPKLMRNYERDRENIEKLRSAGWYVIVVWECELKPQLKDKRLGTLLYEILAKPHRYTD